MDKGRVGNNQSLDDDRVLSSDSGAKLAVMYKPVLALIIKHTQPAYQDMDLKEIEAMIPGNGDIAEMFSTEISFPMEKKVVLDTKFKIRAPNGETEGLILAIDIQGYHESDRDGVRRMIAYLAKMITSQLRPGDPYGSMRSTSLVWLDMDPRKDNRNSILVSDSAFRKEMGGPKAGLEDSGVVRITYVGLDTGTSGSGSDLVDALNILWNDRMPRAERMRMLGDKYGIKASKILERGMESMGNLSEQFRRRGYDEAKEEYEERIAEMRGDYEERIASAVIALMDAGMALDEALDRLCTDDDRNRISEAVRSMRKTL